MGDNAALLEQAREALARWRARPPTDGSSTVSRSQLARAIDHTLLRPEATPDMVRRLCDEARRYDMVAVCVNPLYVRVAAEELGDSAVRVCSVVGFPLGATWPDLKAAEARRAIAEGAREIDMVLAIGALKAGDYAHVHDDIAAVVAACRAGEATCKVIIEAGLLSDEEKAVACLLLKRAGADYAKTSTGFGPGGATVADVSLLRHIMGPDLGVKAAGGVRSYEAAVEMVRAGASRIGTSAGVAILESAPA